MTPTNIPRFGKVKIIDHTVANTEFHHKIRESMIKVKGG